jgi:protein SCO1/2
MPNLQFQLTDDDSRAVTARDYRGEVVLLYFGYTHCPDICPTTLATLSQAIKGLGTDANRVRVLFVTVDPQRDSAALLRRYVGYFGPQFVGLRAADAQLRPLATRYDANFHRDASDRDGNYAVQHSSAVYIFDEQGRARLLTDGTDKPAQITHDLHELIAGA